MLDLACGGLTKNLRSLLHAWTGIWSLKLTDEVLGGPSWHTIYGHILTHISIYVYTCRDLYDSPRPHRPTIPVSLQKQRFSRLLASRVYPVARLRSSQHSDETKRFCNLGPHNIMNNTSLLSMILGDCPAPAAKSMNLPLQT